jgi:hypothetical protein
MTTKLRGLRQSEKTYDAGVGIHLVHVPTAGPFFPEAFACEPESAMEHPSTSEVDQQDMLGVVWWSMTRARILCSETTGSHPWGSNSLEPRKFQNTLQNILMLGVA